jgi:hypothetical protein
MRAAVLSVSLLSWAEEIDWTMALDSVFRSCSICKLTVQGDILRFPFLGATNMAAIGGRT